MRAQPTPATDANARRNARAERDRFARWAPARDALWAMLEPLAGGARVAVVGAGNGDDLPLGRLAEAAVSVTLLDVDPAAARGAARRAARDVTEGAADAAAARRARAQVIACDVTEGAADAVVARAAQGRAPLPVTAPLPPLPGAPYDLVVGDLFYSQLVYPALVDLGLPRDRVRDVVLACAPWLLPLVVRRLHASATRVLHLHDPAAWWKGHPQPRPVEEVLRTGRLAGLRGPSAWDPRAVVDPDAVLASRLWRWPFKAGVDYVVQATLATGNVPSAGTRAAVGRFTS